MVRKAMADRLRWFANKAEMSDLAATSYAFAAQNTMYGGKIIAVGDPIFIFERPKGEPVAQPANAISLS